MAIATRQWTLEECRRLLMESERRPSPHRPRAAGHAGSAHVTLTREQMNERVRNQPAVSAFLNLNDQARALMQVLNHHSGMGAYSTVSTQMPVGRRVHVESRVHGLVTRWATEHRNWTEPSYAAHVILERLGSGQGEFGVHIHTLYPVDHFQHGCATWWTSGPREVDAFQFPDGRPGRL